MLINLTVTPTTSIGFSAMSLISSMECLMRIFPRLMLLLPFDEFLCHFFLFNKQKKEVAVECFIAS